MRVAASGAAPLGTDLAEFYEAIGMPLVEGYGLTEGGVVSFNPIDSPKPGSIGKLLPGVEVRIAEDGELLRPSPCLFSRYYNDPDATAEVSARWLAAHRRHRLRLDADGYLFITGRKKEMIVSSTGKKIYPSRVESLFKFEPLISQVILIGDRLPYLTALFTINASDRRAAERHERLPGPLPRRDRRSAARPRRSSADRESREQTARASSSRSANSAFSRASSPSRKANSPPP